MLGTPFFSPPKTVLISPLDTNDTVSFDGSIECLYKSLHAVIAGGLYTRKDCEVN